jgi:hypothetical protein
LALKNGSSAEIGLLDAAMHIVALQAMTNTRVVVTLTAGDHNGKADVSVGAVAYDRTVESGDQPVLASVSVNCLATRLRTVDAALIHILYLLDGEIARRAMY